MRAPLLVLAGCGRLAFDAQDLLADAATVCAVPPAHDEDGDGIADACDVCPHIAVTQSDDDGDLVGNACDPEPTIPRQQILFFDPFTTRDAWISDVGFGYIEGDDLVMPGTGGAVQVSRPHRPLHDYMAVGYASGAGNNSTQIFAINYEPASRVGRQYCEIYDDGQLATGELRYSYTLDGTIFTTGGSATLTTPFANLTGMLEYTRSDTLSRCNVTTGINDRFATGPPQPSLASDDITILARDVDVRVKYFIQIRTYD